MPVGRAPLGYSVMPPLDAIFPIVSVVGRLTEFSVVCRLCRATIKRKRPASVPRGSGAPVQIGNATKGSPPLVPQYPRLRYTE